MAGLGGEVERSVAFIGPSREKEEEGGREGGRSRRREGEGGRMRTR